MTIVVNFILKWNFCYCHSCSRVLRFNDLQCCDYMFRICSFIVLAPTEGKKLNTGAIVGGVIGGILFLVLIGVAVFFFLRWKSKWSFMFVVIEKVVWRSKTTFFTVKQSFSVRETDFQLVRLQFGGAFYNLIVFKESRSHSKHPFFWKYLQNGTWENTWSVCYENQKLLFL